jgi:hypothetical protein
MPPVGAVCEISSQGADWGVATIQYTADNVVVWRWENQAKGQVCACYRHEIEMRPLNTPEREKAIAEMTEIAGGTYALRDDIIQRLYNAGYRK